MKRTKSEILKSHKIEKKVFTRWINHKLKYHNKFIRDLQFDLCNGEILVELIEILSQKKLEKIRFSNQDRQSRICTLNSVLIFLRLEGMELKNIEPVDILDGSVKKIKELLWILIFHYSIKTFLGENNFDEIGKSFLNWLNSKLDGYFIDNLSSAWNSGIAIGLIVNTCDRDLCTDVLKWNSSNALNNAQFAMEAAFQCFMIPQLLKPIEIIDTSATDKAIMTYVSQFSGLLQERNNNKYDLTGKCLSSVIDDGGNTSMMLAAISTDNISDYHIRQLDKPPDVIKDGRVDLLIKIPTIEKDIAKNLVVEAVDKNGNVYKCTRNGNFSKSNELSFSLIPILSGSFDIFIKKNEYSMEILNKPFRVCVNLPNKKPTIVSYGPGLYGSVADCPGVFILDTNGSDQQIGFSMEGPSKTKIECANIGNGSVLITYSALLPGIYQLSIMVNEENICDSPYSIVIVKSNKVDEIKKVKVIGLENKNTKSFIIDSRNSTFEMPPDVECFDKLGVSSNNILVTELEKKYFRIECPLNNAERLIVFVGYFMVQVEGFPYAIDYYDSNEGQRKVDQFSTFSSLQEKCLEILNQDLVDAIELSVQDLCVDTINDVLVNTRTKKLIIKHETFEESQLKTFKWIDKKFGLILYGTSLSGRPIKKGECQVVQIDLDRSIQGGSIGFVLEGPIETQVQCFAKDDGQYIIKFQPMTAGKYELFVTIDGKSIDGSPFSITVSETSDTGVFTQRSPIYNSDKHEIVTQHLSANSIKIGNTPTNCDVSSLSSTIFSGNERVFKSLSTEYKSKPVLLDMKSLSIPNKIVSNECESLFSSSNTSGNSIRSGVYKAKIRKLSLFSNKDPITRGNFCGYRSKSENDNESSISSSTSMEIEKLSQNYQESVLIFYENMLSAFTNLSVVDIIYYAIERITNLILPDPIQISSFNDVVFKNTFRNSLNSEFSSDNKLSTNSREIHLTFNEITSIKYDESQTLSQITTPAELKIQDSGKYNTISASVDSLLNCYSEKSIGKRPIPVLRSNQISSFEALQDNINMIDETYEYSENNFHVLKSKCVESNYQDSSFGKSTNPMTLTSHTEIAMGDYQKSIGVDVASSMSSNAINTKGDLAKFTDAEVVFDSSSIESRKTSSFISVYDKALTKNVFPITEKSNYKDCPSKSVEMSKVSVYNFKNFKLTADNSLLSQLNKTKFQNLTVPKASNKHSLNMSPKQSKLTLNYENTETESLVSCESIEIPLHIEGRVKKFKTNCLVVHKQLTETRKTESLINYLNVFQTNTKYFVEKPKIFYEQVNENTMSTVSVSEKLPLLSMNYIRMIHFEEEATPFFVDENLKKHLVSVSCLEYSKTRNLANISMLLPNCHQFRCPNPYLSYRHSDNNDKQSENPKLENVIFQEMIQFYVSKYVKDYLKKKLNLRKREIKKSTEKSAQTSSVILEGDSIRNFSDINVLNFKRPINKRVSEISIHRSESKEIHSQDLMLSSNESQDISSAVETLVDAITDIAKNHLILYPSRSNVKRVEELLKLLPRLLELGKEKRLYHINFLTDQLEAILINSTDQSSNKALSQIIKSIKSCVYLGKSNSKRKRQINSGHSKPTDMKQNILRLDSISVKTESGDLSQIPYEVHVIGKALCKGFVNFNNKFVVHTSGKIPGNLAICIEGPSKAEISFMDKKIGIYIVSYRVTIPGEYVCAISFNKVDIPHSPFRITVADDVNRRILHKHVKPDICSEVEMQNKGNSTSIKPVGKNLIFHVSSPEILNLNCFVTEPHGGSSFHPIKKMSKTSNKDGFINVFASTIGVYNIDFYNFLGDKIGPSWKVKIENIHGSLRSTTLSCDVDIQIINPLIVNEIYQNICAYGDGLQQATVNRKNHFFIFLWNYSESIICKEPSLDVTIDGPSKVQISCIEDINGYIFCYIPIVIGLYFIGITYSNKCHIPGSPFKITVLRDPNSDLNHQEFENQ